MVVGVSSRQDDMEVNVCKVKNLTNNRSRGEGVTDSLTPNVIMSLEECLDFLGDDELLEVTPKSLRIRKKFLKESDRRVSGRK
jgi:GTP-binding protein